jgi:hypothetical protein
MVGQGRGVAIDGVTGRVRSAVPRSPRAPCPSGTPRFGADASSLDLRPPGWRASRLCLLPSLCLRPGSARPRRRGGHVTCSGTWSGTSFSSTRHRCGPGAGRWRAIRRGFGGAWTCGAWSENRRGRNRWVYRALTLDTKSPVRADGEHGRSPAGSCLPDIRAWNARMS